MRVHTRAGRVEVVGQPPVSIWFMSSANSSDWINRDLFGGQAHFGVQDLTKLDVALSWLLQ